VILGSAGTSHISAFWPAVSPSPTVNAFFTPACSSPPSVATRPRAAARSPMRGASLPATKAAAVVIDERARPWSRLSPRALRRRQALRHARLEPERMTALHTGALVATFRCAAPARCGAFVDERRVAAGDAGGRVY